MLSEAGRELLSREVGDIARGALEAQVRFCLDGIGQIVVWARRRRETGWLTIRCRVWGIAHPFDLMVGLILDWDAFQVPCLEKCIRQLERTLAEAAAAGVLLTRGGGSGGPGAEGEAGGTRLQFAFEGSGVKGEKQGGEEEGAGGRTLQQGGGHQLPCPRYGGAVFSGPNVLVLFNCTLRGARGRGAGRGEGEEGGAAAEGGEGAGTDKTPQPPRTYGNLLRRARSVHRSISISIYREREYTHSCVQRTCGVRACLMTSCQVVEGRHLPPKQNAIPST